MCSLLFLTLESKPRPRVRRIMSMEGALQVLDQMPMPNLVTFFVV